MGIYFLHAFEHQSLLFLIEVARYVHFMYIFEASYNMSATQVNKIYIMDQSELLNLWAGIGTLTHCKIGSW